MTPEQWGPPIWTMFHTLAEKIKEESYPTVGPMLFSFIYRIVAYLPCPECSQHAREFLGKIGSARIKTKADLVNILYVFHNSANKRKKKPLFNAELLKETYGKRELSGVLNRFLAVYHNKGNMKMLNESFHRNIVIRDFKKWIWENGKHFGG